MKKLSERDLTKKSTGLSPRFLSWMLILLTVLALGNATSAQTYFDDTFNNSDWTWNKLPFPASTAGSSTSSGQITTDGNAVPSRTTSHNLVPGQINVAHLNLNAFYDPSVQGAIGSLSYSYDLRHYSGTLGAAFGFSIVILQNGTYYRSNPVDSALANAWQPFGQSGLSASGFTRISGDSPNNNPDFSCKGSRMQFGYLTSNSNNQQVSRRAGIDNWKVTIVEKKPCASCGTIGDQKVTCDKGGFTYTFTVTNNSPQVIQYLLLSPPSGATYTISPNVINLGGSPLNPGQSTTVSVTIGNASPGDEVCVNVSLADKSLAVCCTVQTCVKLPECPCLKSDYSVKCGGNGAYTLTVGIQNQTGAAIQQVFAVATTPAGMNVSPQLVTLPTPLNPGQTTTITLTISGVPAGQEICLRLTPVSEKNETCCSIRICLKLPECPLISGKNNENPKPAAAIQMGVSEQRRYDVVFRDVSKR